MFLNRGDESRVLMAEPRPLLRLTELARSDRDTDCRRRSQKYEPERVRSERIDQAHAPTHEWNTCAPMFGPNRVTERKLVTSLVKCPLEPGSSAASAAVRAKRSGGRGLWNGIVGGPWPPANPVAG